MGEGRLPLPVGPARIGPNAILQLVTVLDRAEGRALRDQVMAAAGVAMPDPSQGMIPEVEAAAVHQALRMALPERSTALLWLAGLATADYILQHRIPLLAQWLIRALPAPVGARVLSHAIARHAWTFVGSGAFRIVGFHPLTFKVTGNPLVKGQQADHPLCDWHAAVFQRLFDALVWPGCVVREVSCTATGHPACRFEVQPPA